jgi:hypothetical protein
MDHAAQSEHAREVIAVMRCESCKIIDVVSMGRAKGLETRF